MTDKKLLNNNIDLLVKEAKFDCSMAKDREKNTKETSSIASSFSKYIWTLKSSVDDVDFDTFANNAFAEVNGYLVGTQDYDATINNILQYKKTFSNKFLR